MELKEKSEPTEESGKMAEWGGTRNLSPDLGHNCAGRIYFLLLLLLLLLLFFFFCLFRVVPTAYGISQAKRHIGTAAANLYHSHSNVGSDLLL